MLQALQAIQAAMERLQTANNSGEPDAGTPTAQA
jgi:hypothetical protein